MRLWPSGSSRIYREEQTEEKRIPAGPRTVAVSSGKGGVGKTTFSVNLALCLAGMGKQVTLFDADLGLANVEVLLGMSVKNTLHDVLFGDYSIDDIIVEGPLGIKIISSGSGMLKMANLDQARRLKLLKMLDQYCSGQEFVIIDTGAGLNKNVLGFAAAAGEVFVVVTPEPTSMTDAYALVKVLATYKVHDEFFLIINRASDKNEAMETFRRMQAATDRFLDIKLNFAGWIPEDRLVSEAIKKQEPFFIHRPASQISARIADIASYISGEGQRTENQGFWNKLLRFFG